MSIMTGLAVFLTSSTQGEDWYRWRGPHLDGISRETNWSSDWPAQGPKVLWHAQVGQGYASFVIADGRVYTTGNTADTDTLYCLDANSGEVIWKHAYPEPLGPKYYDGGTSATPTVDGDTVYQLSKQGQLMALTTDKGQVKWKLDVAKVTGAKLSDWGFGGSPFVLDDKLILNVGTHGVAVDKASGKVRWSSGKGQAGFSTPRPFSITKSSGIAIFTGTELVGINPENGDRLWGFPWKTQYDVNAADPIFKDNQVFVSSGYRSGGAVFDLSTGQARKVWANQNMHNQFNTSVLIGEHLYGITGQDGKPGSGIACVEFATGEQMWKDGAPAFGAIAAAGDRLIIMGEKGELMIARAQPTKFEILAQAQILGGRCWTTPVLANGRIYVRNSKGNVACVDVSK
jgi:outer membrane protein assembly factor BamB